MAYPFFSRTTMTTLTFPRGPSLPDEHAYSPRQRVSYSEAGQARIVTFSAAEETFVLTWNVLPVATVTLLLAWFTHALINWSAGSFTYTDVDGVATTVRLVPGTFRIEKITSGLASVSLTLRKEPF